MLIFPAALTNEMFQNHVTLENRRAASPPHANRSSVALMALLGLPNPSCRDLPTTWSAPVLLPRALGEPSARRAAWVSPSEYEEPAGAERCSRMAARSAISFCCRSQPPAGLSSRPQPPRTMAQLPRARGHLVPSASSPRPLLWTLLLLPLLHRDRLALAALESTFTVHNPL